MENNVYLVFSKPPETISADEYDRWYDHHVRENIVSPGFVSARRFDVTPAREAPVAFSHLAMYEHEGDVSIWRTDLNERIRTGDVVLPDWFDQITFGAWSCRPLSDRILPVR